MNNVKQLDDIRLIGLIFNDELFGQELANITIYRMLQESGAQVRVGAQFSNAKPEVRKRLDQLGIPVFRLPYGTQWSKTFFKKHPLLVLKNVAAIARCSAILENEIQTFRPTHVLIPLSLAYSYTFPALRKKSFELVYRTGDLAPVDSKPQLFLWRKCVQRADKIVVNSRFVMDSLLKNSNNDAGAKASLIYNFPPNGLIGSREVVRVAKDKKVVLYVGQITEHKGVTHFVDAAIELCKENPHWEFWIVGGSEYSSVLENELWQKVESFSLRNRIVFHGKVPNPSEFYRCADLHVAPTIGEEPAANVVVEAMSFGVPSVVYRSGGLPELVRHNETGIVCCQRDKNELINELRQLLNSPERIAMMSANSLALFEQRFGKERFVQEWKKVLLKK